MPAVDLKRRQSLGKRFAPERHFTAMNKFCFSPCTVNHVQNGAFTGDTMKLILAMLLQSLFWPASRCCSGIYALSWGPSNNQPGIWYTFLNSHTYDIHLKCPLRVPGIQK